MLFIPLVCGYLALTSDIFLNTSCKEARGLEKFGNTLLIPCHYLFVGQVAQKDKNNEWVFSNKFDYQNHFLIKTIGSAILAIPSFFCGVLCKALSFIDPHTRALHQSLCNHLICRPIANQNDIYTSHGIQLVDETQKFISQNHQRRPGDEKNLSIEKKALRDITKLLNKTKISWWVDCGTLLGVYRYGGVIPWDDDIDIAILRPDFHTVKKILTLLDPQKYIVQDWSTRLHPNSFLKVFIRESKTMIDIYTFDFFPDKKELVYNFAMGDFFFSPKWWVHREKKFTIPVAFETLFPLKKATFDGIEVFVPNDTKKYLERGYGNNLDPIKIYDPITQNYEKDLTHPYWNFIEIRD